jgi:plasmid stability protein
MAPEILSSFERRPSMDIFSFGISVYEIFLTTLQENRRAHHDPEVESSYSSSSSSSGSMPDLLHAGGATAKAIPRPGFAGLLPFDGPRWHALRSGAADPVRTISAELREIVSSMMAAEAEARPTSVEVLRTPMVFQAKQDLFLSSYAPAAAKVHIARSHSYKESMGSSLTAALNGNGNGTQQSLAGRMCIPPLDVNVVGQFTGVNSGPNSMSDRVMTPLGGVSFWHPTQSLLQTSATDFQSSPSLTGSDCGSGDSSKMILAHSPCSFTPR